MCFSDGDVGPVVQVLDVSKPRPKASGMGIAVVAMSTADSRRRSPNRIRASAVSYGRDTPFDAVEVLAVGPAGGARVAARVAVDDLGTG